MWVNYQYKNQRNKGIHERLNKVVEREMNFWFLLEENVPFSDTDGLKELKANVWTEERTVSSI